MPNWPCSGINYAHLEEFMHISESVTQINYALRIIPHNKIVPNEIEASYLVVLISFYALILTKTYRFSIFSYPKNYSIRIKGQSEHSGLCPDIRAVLFEAFWFF